MPRRLVLTAVACSVVVTLGVSPASAVDGDAYAFDVVAATSLMLERPADNARAEGTLVLSRQDGVVQAQIRVCEQPDTCTVVFDGVASEAEVSEVGETDLHFQSPIPGFGDMDLFLQGDGPVNKDGCADPSAGLTYTAAGAEVFAAYEVTGTFGAWQVTDEVCGHWGRQAALVAVTS